MKKTVSVYFSNAPLRPGFEPVKGCPRSSQVQYSGLQYRGGREVMTQNGEKDLWWYGSYGYTVMRWFLRGKRYQVRESSIRWRGLLARGLSMCELEVWRAR